MDYTALAKQAGAISSTPAPSSSSGAPIDYNALAKQAGAVPQQTDHGLVGNILAGVLKTPARLATNVIQAGELATGNKTTSPLSGGFLGNVIPVGNTGKGFVNDVKDSVGAGAELGSYLVGGGEAQAGLDALKGGELIAKPTLQTILGGAKAGIVPGALNSLGSSLQNPNASLGNVVGNTILGGTLGAATGGALAGAGKALEASGIPQRIVGAIPDRLKNIASAASDSLNDHIQNVIDATKDLVGRGEKNVAGKIVPTGQGLSGLEVSDPTILNGAEVQPSSNDIRRAQAVAPYLENGVDKNGITQYIDPTKNPALASDRLDKTAADFAKNTVTPYLQENSSPANFQEINDYMQNTPKPSNIGKGSVDEEAFNDTLKKATDLITGKGEGAQGLRDNYDANDVNEARKGLDKLARDQEGQYPVNKDGNNGAKAAIDAARTQMNNLSEDMLRYPDISKVNAANEDVAAFKGGASNGQPRRVGVSDEELKQQMYQKQGLTPNEQKAQVFQTMRQHQQDLLEARNNLDLKGQQGINLKTGKGPSGLKKILGSPTARFVKKATLPVAGAFELGHLFAEK